MKPPVDAGSSAPRALSKAMRASYVLIAEVDILHSAGLLEALTPFRLGALVARDTPEAVQTIQRFGPPAILIISMSLPPRDGLEVMSALRSVAGSESSAIIAMVPYGGAGRIPADVRRSLGISSVLPYSASLAALRAAVRKALDEAGMARSEGFPALEVGESTPEVIEAIIRDLTSRATRLTGAAGSVVYVLIKPFERFRAHVEWMSDRAAIDSPFAAPYALDWVLRTGDVLVLPDLSTHPVGREQPETLREVVRALIAIPLIGEHSRIVGALCVFDVRPLTVSPLQLEALKALGRDGGRLLETIAPLTDGPVTDDRGTRLAAAATPGVAVDPATGLLTREIGRGVVGQEAARARDRQRPMSLILIGVDYFESIDAVQGREAIDRTMRRVSQTIRVVLRGSDLAVRWDAGEFLILLPTVGLPTAGDVAERIRQAVQTSRSRDMPPITVSCGLTECAPGESPESALERAQSQLAGARKKGGNRIEWS